MAMVRQRGKRFELRIKHKLLPNGIYTTSFESEAEARSYAVRIEALLVQGHVPLELVSKHVHVSNDTLAKVIRDYLAAVPASASDVAILDLLFSQIGAERADSALKYQWADDWVRSLKIVHHLAPGTIRKRVGALARVLDWFLKRLAKTGEAPLANPLRLLPKNYSVYNVHEQLQLKASRGLEAKRDIVRDRRLAAQEEGQILAALRGARHPARERALELPDGDALQDLFVVLVNSGLRLREAYKLRVRDVKLELRTVHIRTSKSGAARDIPLLPAVFAVLERRVNVARVHGPDTPIFPWWTAAADAKALNGITALLSAALARAFAYAGCSDLKPHDLRHEATCRWVLMRDRRGGWLFRSEEIMRITGHKDPKVFMRYVSLRGSDLAERLWPTPA